MIKNNGAIPGIAFIEPEIAQNAGAILRLSACTGAHVDFVGPFSFVWSDKKMKRAGMDYIDTSSYEVWDSFHDFMAARKGCRMIALCAEAKESVYDFRFDVSDIIMIGSESTGLSQHTKAASFSRLHIPMKEGARSLNAAMSAGIALFEAIRQVG